MQVETNSGSKTIPIQKVKESDKVLVADASGVRFEPVIIVDLHKVDIDHQLVCVETASGKSVSLTIDHMMIVHQGLNAELVPAGKVLPGMQIEIFDESVGKCVSTEVIAINPVASTTVEGLANILTASETIVVNGIVGSVLTESCAARPARKLLKAVHSVMGTKVARCTYRIMEWALDNNYATKATL